MGRNLGVVLTLSNVLFDLVVYFGIFGVADYFAYASIWVGGLLLIVPWNVGLRYRPAFVSPAGVR